MSMELRPISGIQWSVTTLQPGASTGLATSGTISAGSGIGNAQQVQLDPNNNNTDTSVGHVTVQADWTSLLALGQPLNGWSGEIGGQPVRPAVQRERAGLAYLRLPGRVGGDGRAGGGHAGEPAAGLRGRRPGHDLRAAAGVRAGLPHVRVAVRPGRGGDAGLGAGPPGRREIPAPTDDDAYTANDVTATRTSGSTTGSSFRAVLADGTLMSISPPPQGAGSYATTISANLSTDTQLPDLAGWLVHLGTVPGARYPAIPADLARPATSSLFYQLQGINTGDYIRIINPPPWLTPGDIRKLAAGVTEEIGGYTWRLTWNGIPEVPYETAVSDDLVYGHADTDGSALASAIDPAATSMSVRTTGPSGVIWTVSAAELPVRRDHGRGAGHRREHHRVGVAAGVHDRAVGQRRGEGPRRGRGRRLCFAPVMAMN